MDYTRFYLIAVLILALVHRGAKGDMSELRSMTCRLINDKLSSSNLWSNYPIVFEPITRGRLIVWTGESTLPSSEFQCHGRGSRNDSIVLDFANFSNKLDWTFYDSIKGVIHHGYSVNDCHNMKYDISIVDKESRSYTDCNTISSIDLDAASTLSQEIRTSCRDCSQSLTSLIDSQVKELFKWKLNEQIIENLYWQLTQLLTNQHSGNSMSLKDDIQ